jgi:AcrR family transcriptional regulator
MRVKTDARRQAILEVATEVFREVGYERASMAMISARVGGSKATLYSYFKSKEELFAAAMMEAMQDQGEEVLKTLDHSESNVRDVLIRFGHAYLRLVTSADTLAITRTAIAETSNAGLGEKLYALGPKRGWEEIGGQIARLQERGILRPADPRLVAAHLKGMIEAGFVEPLLFGAPAEFPPAMAVAGAIDAFLCAYGSDEVKTQAKETKPGG